MSLKEWLDVAWLVFLFILLCYFWRVRLFFKCTKAWSITKGQIIELTWTKENQGLWPKIEYCYQVDEQNYFGNKLFLGGKQHYPRRAAHRIAYQAVIAYEKGEEVDVFYNPKAPEQSVLNTSIPRKLNFIIFLLSLLMILHVIIKFAHLGAYIHK